MNKSKHSALNNLFEQLSEGQTPDFLQMMNALSDVSTIFPDTDSASCASIVGQNGGCPVYLDPASEKRCQNC